MNRQSTEAFEQWNFAVSSICGEFLTRPSDRENLFIGEISQRDLGSLTIAHIRCNAGSIRRPLVNATHTDDRHCFLVLQRSGQMYIEIEQQTILLEPGDMALLDPATAFEMRPKGLFSQASFHLSRDILRRPSSQQVPRSGKLARISNCAHLLRSLVQELIAGDAVSVGAMHEGQALQEAIVALLIPALQSTDEPTIPVPSRLHIERLIMQSLADENLRPEYIAQRFGISVRQLHRIFEAQNESVCRYIQRQRLHRSAIDLCEPMLHRLPITAIAHKWGFADSAHFSRAFKRQYGMAPMEYRAQDGAT
ncbi:transcriptional regulator FeaR [Pseudomonas lalucatii]|nr:transcriptional regulator FeaR [Pseudomonas lalucatii]